MKFKDWKYQLFTIPNLLSLLRLGLIPVCVALYRRAAAPREYFTVGTLLALSCVTDLLDGWIARRFHMVSDVGMVLDPLADKLTQLAVILCLAARYPMIYPLLGLFLAKELFQLLVCLRHLRRGKALYGALPEGKLCTAVLFVSLILLVMFPGIGSAGARGLLAADSFLLLVSFRCYVRAYYGQEKRLRDL